MINLPNSIEETQQSIFEKKFSCVELVDSYLNRIRVFDDRIKCFLTVSEEQAYDKAKWIDNLVSENQKDDLLNKYPLLGAVFSFKDLFLTKNIRTTAGSKILESYIPQYSSSVYENIMKAGGILIGKTNCDAWAHGSSGENSDYFPTKNPWNYDYVPGGSSSGSAASVTSKFCLSSFGTETGGSVRQPANFCGVFGLKPTYGSISRYGVIAMSSSLDCVGYFTNTTDDSSKIFNTVNISDGFDANFSFASKKIKSKYNIGIPKEFFDNNVDQQVKANIKKAISIFEKNGHNLIEVSLPHTKNAIDVYYIIQPAEVSSNLSRYDGVRYGNSRNFFGSEAVRRILLGTYVLSKGYYDEYYLKAMKVRSILTQEINNVFTNVDFLLAPVSPTPAFKLGEKSKNPLQMYLSDIFTITANIVGIPSLSIPYGNTDLGLPLGFQIMGPRNCENTIFDISKKFESYINFVPAFPNLS